jgi:hypothetical protein
MARIPFLANQIDARRRHRWRERAKKRDNCLQIAPTFDDEAERRRTPAHRHGGQTRV